MLESPAPFRTADIHADPRLSGWWPDAHPDMRSLLGVPIVAPEGVIGAFYMTEKEGTAALGEEDQQLIELLAAHAAIAITNARLYEQSRKLSILAERNRLALELHDVVSQKLFSLVLTAEAAATLLDRDEDAARAKIGRLQELAREALDELRSLILELTTPVTRRSCASPKRRCRTRCATRRRRTSECACPTATDACCSRSTMTGSALTRPRRRCVHDAWG